MVNFAFEDASVSQNEEQRCAKLRLRSQKKLPANRKQPNTRQTKFWQQFLEINIKAEK